MATIPKMDLNYRLNDSPAQEEFPRDYMGLSQIGNSCHRALQYYHYWAFKEQIKARIRRLFDDGHRAEDVLIEALARQGWITINMQAEIIGTAGHWKGHIDGEIYNTSDPTDILLVEFKTHNDKSFKLLKKDGVKKSKPGHYGQIQAYMGYRKRSQCMYVGYNKNDSEIWTDIIDFDQIYYDELKRKEMEIIVSDTLHPRIGTGTPAWFECKFCNASSICFKKKAPERSCRTCDHIDILGDGVWSCSLHDKFLSSGEQRVGCSDYTIGKMFSD